MQAAPHHDEVRDRLELRVLVIHCVPVQLQIACTGSTARTSTTTWCQAKGALFAARRYVPSAFGSVRPNPHYAVNVRTLGVALKFGLGLMTDPSCGVPLPATAGARLPHDGPAGGLQPSPKFQVAPGPPRVPPPLRTAEGTWIPPLVGRNRDPRSVPKMKMPNAPGRDPALSKPPNLLELPAPEVRKPPNPR